VFSSVLHCVSSVLQRVAVCCSVLQCVAVCCSVLQCLSGRDAENLERNRLCLVVCCSVLQCVLQCVAMCCNVLQVGKKPPVFDRR